MYIRTQDPVLNLLSEVHTILQVWYLYFQNYEKEQISHLFPLQCSSRHVRSLESDWRKQNMRHQDSWLGKTLVTGLDSTLPVCTHCRGGHWK